MRKVIFSPPNGGTWTKLDFSKLDDLVRGENERFWNSGCGEMAIEVGGSTPAIIGYQVFKAIRVLNRNSSNSRASGTVSGLRYITYAEEKTGMA